MVIIFEIIMLIVVFGVAVSMVKKVGSGTASFINVRTIISMLFFGGIGYAVGAQVSGDWSMFGAIFGVFLGIELKKKPFDVTGEIYRDITDER